MHRVNLRCWALASAIAVAVAAPAWAQETRRFDIPQQDLVAALEAFGKQSGKEILFDRTQTQGKAAPAVDCDCAPGEALRRLLAGSGLSYRMANADTYLVEPAGPFGAAAGDKNEATTYDFDIPSQDLAAALKAFTRITGQQVVFDNVMVRDKVSMLLQGSYTADDGAGLLLNGTGLTVRRDPQGTFLVKEDSPLQGSPGTQEGATTLDTIVVTGSRISGSQGSSPVTTIHREDIDQSGIATAHGIVQTLPQVFTGGANEEIRGTGLDAQLNANRFGSTIDIRGLGSDSTLILLNGRRLPRGGGSGSFVDVSSIPESAIDRVEVLLDGASAIYGSDAIGGVVNYILREDFEGAQTSLRYGTAQGGAQEVQASQLLGGSWDGGNALISYEHYKRERLGREERDYTRSSDLRPLGGDLFGPNFGNPGFLRVGSSRFRIPDGQDGSNLLESDLLPFSGPETSVEGQDILPEQERDSVFVTARQDLTPTIKVGLEGWYNRRNYNARIGGKLETLMVPANNPFRSQLFPGQTIFVDYNWIDDLGTQVIDGSVDSYGVVANASFDIGEDWQARSFVQYASDENTFLNTGIAASSLLAEALGTDNPATAFDPARDGFLNPFGDGSHTSARVLDFIRGELESQSQSSTLNASLTFEGKVMDLPGGEVRLAIGAEHGKEEFSGETRQRSSIAEIVTLAANNQRQLTSAFAEVMVPVIGANNTRVGVQRLEFTGALRHERYDDDVVLRGNTPSQVQRSTTNPKFGALWTITNGFSLRASWGTSFRAPNLRELNTLNNQIAVAPLLDPASPTGFTTTMIRDGNRPGLEEETATTWTAGFRFEPEAIAGLQLDIGYFDIDLANRIDKAPNTTAILQQAARFAPLITRNPSRDEIDALCASPEFVFGNCVGTIGALVDNRLNNIGVTQVRGIDSSIKYRFNLAGGSAFIASDASYLFEFSEAITEDVPLVDISNTLFNQPRFKARNSFAWLKNGFSGSLYWNHVNSYRDTISLPNRKIDSWDTFDLSVAYTTAGPQSSLDLLGGITLRLSMLNAFDTDPPFVNSGGGGYDQVNADAIGRTVSFQVSKQW